MNKKRILTIEIIIWILLAGIGAYTCTAFINRYLGEQKKYEAVFRDIDSLAVGSPVRFMGTQVGHVTKTMPGKGQVFVNFVITDKNVEIPAGSVVSIEFTGIAGSKSIEIKPLPKSQREKTNLIVSEPIRVNSLIDLQKEIAESISDFSENVLNMFEKEELENIKKNIESSNEITSDTIESIKYSKNIINTTRNRIVTGIESSKSYIKQQDDTFAEINKSFEADNIDKQFSSSLSEIKNSLDKINKKFDRNSMKNSHKSLDNSLKKFNKSIQSLHTKTQQQIFVINKGASFVAEKFSDFSDFLGNKVVPEGIKAIEIQTKNFKNQTEKINNKLKP